MTRGGGSMRQMKARMGDCWTCSTSILVYKSPESVNGVVTFRVQCACHSVTRKALGLVGMNSLEAMLAEWYATRVRCFQCNSHLRGARAGAYFCPRCNDYREVG